MKKMPDKRVSGLRTIWFFLKPYQVYLYILFGLCMLNGLLETLHMALLFPILSASLERGTGLSDNPFFNILDDITEILPIDDVLISSCVLFAILTVLYSSSRLLYANLTPKLIAKIVRDHEQKIFHKYTSFDYRYFVDHKQGDLIYRGSQAPQFIGNTLAALNRAAVEIVLAIFVLFLLISISWKGTIAVIVAGGMYYYFTSLLSKRISYKTGKEMRQAIADENVVMNEYLSGVRQIRATLGSWQWVRKFNRASVSRWKHWSINQFWIEVPKILLELTMFGVIALTVIIIKIQYPDKFFSMIPMFGTFAFAIFKLLPKLITTGTSLMKATNWLPNLETVRETLLDNTYEQIKTGALELKQLESNIEFKNVTFTYAGRDSTLANVSLEITKDNATAIVGPSGSGKSTIVDLILRLYDVDEGEILIDRRNIREYNISSFLGIIGFVGQETFIFNASIKENITFGNDYTEKDIEEAARLANAHQFIEQLPERYDTIVGDRGIKLSGGEKQRIAVARAVIRKPQLLILDEATSSLDNISEGIVQTAIDKVSSSCTTVIIAHRLSTIRNANKIYVMDEGQLIESGNHDQLISYRGKYWELYNRQQ